MLGEIPPAKPTSGAGRAIGLDLPAGCANSDLATALGRVLLPLGILVENEVAPHGGADFFPLQLNA